MGRMTMCEADCNLPHAHPAPIGCRIDPMLPPAPRSVPVKHRDPTRAPSHYVARFRRNGIEPGAEMLDWLAATRGPAAVIDHLRCEIGSKAQRLGLRGEGDAERLKNELRDLFAIEQATTKLRAFLEHVQDAVPHGKDCET